MATVTDQEILEYFEKYQGELSQERNDFFLPQIVDYINDKKWVTVRPQYQRRPVWDNKKKSRLIESLLMNVPIPPIYLYENDFNRYEVMDGQQRLNSILEFYSNRLKLSSLDSWKILNGKTYDDLPQKVQRGLDRRRIAATVIVSDLSDKPYGPDDIRRQVFDRLNTGGLGLNPQELRNCLYPGEFNKLIISLAGYSKFTSTFRIPDHTSHIIDGKVSKELSGNTLYKRMVDCELVLRFFTFREKGGLRGSIPRALDKCMAQYTSIGEEEAKTLGELFTSRLDTAIEIFDDETFFIPEPRKSNRPSIPLYDATMIALDREFQHKDQFILHKADIKAALSRVVEDDVKYEIIIGKPGTAQAIKDRIALIQETLCTASGVDVSH